MNKSRDETVAVTLYEELEDASFEGGYVAVTMTGVPENVQIIGTDPHSSEKALDHLARGLRVLGFGGKLLIDDVTQIGRNDRYEVAI